MIFGRTRFSVLRLGWLGSEVEVEVEVEVEIVGFKFEKGRCHNRPP
jgi:hypothetical protein